MPRRIHRREFVHGGVASLLTAASYDRVLGANNKVGVGFVGFGLIGKRHVLDFQAQPDANLIGVAETHKGRLAEAQALIGGAVRGHADFRRLLDDRDIQAVVISTPDHWHALMTMLACAAGKDVYVEKPLTLFVREGRWMTDVARRHARVVQVGTQQRSGNHYLRARELIQKGRLGRIQSVRMQAFRNITPGYGAPPDSKPPAELNWDLWQGPAPDRAYNVNRAIYHFRWFWDYSGGQMTNLGAHSLDILQWYLDVRGPLAASSMGGRFSLRDNGETPDTQDAIFQYPGFTATWSHREASRGQPNAAGLEFFGSNGSLAISRKGFLLTPDPKVAPENTVPQFTATQPVGGAVPIKKDGPAEYWTEAMRDDTGDQRQQFSAHVRNFLDCIKSRKNPVSDLESSHRVATACHLANISLRLGRSMRWNLEREEIIGDREAATFLERPYRAPWDAELRASLR